MERVCIRILQLKNNFYRDIGSPRERKLGDYCVLGYFDAFDTYKKEIVQGKEFNIWGHLGELTSRLDGTVNCRMLVCITDREDKDREFWEDPAYALFFVTMVRIRSEMSAEKLNSIIEKLSNSKNSIGYLSYDHSEIIAVTKTNKYSDGITYVGKLRNICNAIKMYTVFAVKENVLMSYDSIKDKIEDEKVCCRLHCMVKDYEQAERFRKELQKRINKRNKSDIKVCKYEILGGYDWLMELNEISVWSILELYRMGELLTHTNIEYNKSFYNIESEILVE